MRFRRPTFVAVLVLAGVLSSPAMATRGLTIGFNSESVFTAGIAASRSFWMGRAASEGAAIVRVNVNWSLVAPARRPPGFTPANPASPGYNWTGTDAVVRGLTSHGLQVLLNLEFAPTWAEGAGMPAGTAPGTWRPDPAQFASFARAVALRYSGRLPDPQNPGAFLPRVRSGSLGMSPTFQTS
jgi:hypothetical protein